MFNHNTTLIFFRHHVELSARSLGVSTSKPSGWFHTIINFFGNRFVVYHDGIEQESSFGTNATKIPGDGRIVGKLSTDVNGIYTSVQVDEMLFFNRSLTETEVTVLANVINN